MRIMRKRISQKPSPILLQEDASPWYTRTGTQHRHHHPSHKAQLTRNEAAAMLRGATT
eukprot:CAMPEP_0118880906 /NCGR_PEP_ID=MMETSP1163-20130328/20441_1 /TAXON_ID=124430 /ORGANISM="Phaeomonas parva, Strain CCMP2877" /LENGTH=57 /DNA_ID=CAMNT_0006817505 /DNA_START=263 /DNA_END=436 /DNA_ORIENTATION=+